MSQPLGRLILTALSCVGSAGPALAGLPDWARPIAEEAAPPPEGIPPHPSRALFSEVRYDVQRDGKIRIRRRLALQALSTTADAEVGTGTFTFAGTTKIKKTKAWHVPPDKKGRKSMEVPVDVTLQDSFLTDTKVRAKRVSGVKKGSLVFFEFEAIDEPYFMMLHHLFFEGIPTDIARFQIQLPPGWDYRPVWLRRQGPDPVLEEGAITWEMRDLPAAEAEPYAPDPRNESPLIAVHVIPPPDVSTYPEIFSDWDSFSRWFQDLARGRGGLTPALRREAETAVASVDGGFLARVEAVGRHVRDKIRYVAVELGIGGYQPRPASQTLENLYGDCKDKGTLFQAMLSAHSIPSYSVLVNLSLDDTVIEEYPFGLFNHLVVAIPVPPDVDMPERFAPAIVDAGDLGRLLIVDTTDEMTSIGSLSAALAGKKALVAAGAQGRLVTLSVNPDAHRIHRVLDVDVSDSGVRGRRHSTYVGQFAASNRRDYGRSAEDRFKGIEERIVELWPDARVTDHRVEYEAPDGAFVEDIDFERGGLGASGSGALVLFAGADDEVPRVSLRKRKTAVDYGYPMTIRYDVTYKGIRQEALPAPRVIEGDGWSVRTDYESGERVLTASWEVRLERARFEPDRFTELRKLWRALSSTARTTVTLVAGDVVGAGNVHSGADRGNGSRTGGLERGNMAGGCSK